MGTSLGRSTRRVGWRCARLPPVRVGPDYSANGNATDGSAASTTVTEAPVAQGPSKDAILARIARAKQYKQASPAVAAPGEQATPTAPSAEPGSGGGGSSASLRATALPNIGPTRVDWGAVVGFLDAPVTTERVGQPVSYGGTAPEPSAADEAAEAAAKAERERRFMAEPSQKDYMDMLMNSPRRAGTGSAFNVAEALAGVLAEPPAGGDAADGAGGADAISPDQRMEEFTAAKEARLRALGGEVITADPLYNPGDNVAVRVSMGEGAGQMAGPEAAAMAEARRLQAEAERRAAEELAAKAAAEAAAARAEEEARAAAAAAEAPSDGSAADGEVYKPKVSTWGMFPRPKDISEAYGGGRNLKPGQALETPTQRQERERSYAAALAAYKAKAGLEVDPEEEERAGKLYEEGMELFNAGQLKASYDKFEKVLAAVPVKTKYGGLATLQKAIVLDSVGQSEAAQKLYKSIANHGVAQVAKKAKQMLFSFEAMTFMKADQFNYGVKKADYDKYFRPLADRRTLYVATEEERRRDEEAMRWAGLVAAVVILTPVAAVAALALQR